MSLALKITFLVLALTLLAVVLIVYVYTALDKIPQTENYADNNTLIFTIVIWRHGSRSPNNFYPTDPHKNSSMWAACGGTGKLTNAGQRQQYALGQWLRRRYARFLPDIYSDSDIQIQSMDSSRMLNAAYLTAAGLYPPVDEQQWMSGLMWQPIPVHTVRKSMANLLGFPWCKQPEFQRIFDVAVESPSVLALLKSKQKLLDFVNERAGFQPNGTWSNIWNMEVLRNDLCITKEHNLELPEWAAGLFMHEDIEQIAMLKYLLPAHTDELAKYSVGYWLKGMLKMCQQKVAGILEPLMWAYSVREINQIMLMHVLGVFDNKRPLFVATLLLELRLDADNEPCLQMFYKKSYNDDVAQPLCIPRCGCMCKVQTMNVLFKSILPTDAEYETALMLTN